MRQLEKEIVKLQGEIQNIYNHLDSIRQEFQGTINNLHQEFRIERLQKENEELKKQKK